MRLRNRTTRLRNHTMVHDAHRHIGVLPAYPFYGGPPVNPDTTARATVKQLIADLDAEGTERALVIPNYGVPDPAIAFSFNELALEAAQSDDRIRAGLWVSPRPEDAQRTAEALQLAGETGVKALKLSFLLGGRPTDPACRPQLDRIFAEACRTTSSSMCTPLPAPPPTSTRSATSSTGTPPKYPSISCTSAAG